MRSLALDTATRATTVALFDADAGLELEARDDPPPGARPNHARALLGLVDAVLKRSGSGWAAVDRIAVGVGPGTFVGLRIGVASAQALARGRHLPLVAVSTLDSLAVAAADQCGSNLPILAVIDARRGEAFAGGAGESPRVLAPEALVEVGRGRLAVGDGAIVFSEGLRAGGATVPEASSPLHRVSALWHARLAETAIPEPLNAIQPRYLRVPDAELPR